MKTLMTGEKQEDTTQSTGLSRTKSNLELPSVIGKPSACLSHLNT